MSPEQYGTFTPNNKLPVHNWYKYSAGYSAQWVQSEILTFESVHQEKAVVLDPFVGSGTTAIAGCSTGNHVYGFDGHPFVIRVAQAKSLWMLDVQDFLDSCHQVLNRALCGSTEIQCHDIGSLMSRCYADESLAMLDRLKLAYLSMADEDPIWQLVWLCITTILRECSKVGTAPCQYVLPNKVKARVSDVQSAFMSKAHIMADDMLYAQRNGWTDTAHLARVDSRHTLPSPMCNLMVTSPPYPNNYDYADATRLEMVFWGEIDGWGDLKTAVRPTLMRSCSQHSSADKVILDSVLTDALLEPILNSITPVVRSLETVRLAHGGKKTYHTMIAAYFMDISKVLKNCRSAMQNGSELVWMIGDSAPYGVYVPVDQWVGELALAHGFKSFTFEKTRNRNTKWKNRKHRVPLHEGVLRIYG